MPGLACMRRLRGRQSTTSRPRRMNCCSNTRPTLHSAVHSIPFRLHPPPGRRSSLSLVLAKARRRCDSCARWHHSPHEPSTPLSTCPLRLWRVMQPPPHRSRQTAASTPNRSSAASRTPYRARRSREEALPLPWIEPGNYSDSECAELLALVAKHMDASNGDRFLIGVDTPHS